MTAAVPERRLSSIVARLLIAPGCVAFLVASASAARPVRADAAAAGEQTVSSVRVLRLDDAQRIARERQPAIRKARAETSLAEARVEQSRAPLLPQLLGTVSYQRTTGNFVPRPGQVPRSVSATDSGSRAERDPFTLYNFFNFGLSATQVLYDFGASTGAYRANRELVRAQESSARAVEQDVAMLVGTAFLQARAYQELVGVARENLANSERHLNQTQTFVEAGTRPEIDLVQVRTDVANARVQLIQAENAFAVGKATLEQAMGGAESSPYELSEETLPALPEEGLSQSQLYVVALRARPEIAAFEYRNRAQRMYTRAAKGSYAPALSASTSLTAGGTELGDLVANWNAGVVLVWPLFQGGLTQARVHESRAIQESLLADQDAARLAIGFELERARLGVHAAKAVEQAAHEVGVNAKERLRLAEKRYEAGVGNAIELGDARLVMTTAQAQEVHAAYNLAIARVSLRKALGSSP